MEMTLTDEEIETWRLELSRETANVIQQLNTSDDDPALNTARHFADASSI